MEMYVGIGTLVLSCLGWAAITLRHIRNESKHQGALEQKVDDLCKRISRVENVLNGLCKGG